MRVKTKFGERLKELREEHKLTQEQVAEQLGTSKPTINRYEKNIREPEYDTLIKIADLFQVSLDYLVGRADTK